MAKKMPSDIERQERIARNVGKLPASAQRNLKQSVRGGEIIKQAVGNISGIEDLAKPHKKYKVK